ncbi:MAG: gas vesicle protein GvpL [Gemmatimonadaceae bacterium]
MARAMPNGSLSIAGGSTMPECAFVNETSTTSVPPREGAKYVYSVIRQDCPKAFALIGIRGGMRVYTVQHEDIAAVVSDAATGCYDATRDDVVAHELVNESLMRETAVIPMAVGTAFPSEADVRELLRSTYDAFRDALHRMHDKIEFGLKILWDRDKVVAHIEREEDEIRELKRAIARQGTSATHLARMRLGRLTENALKDLGNRCVTEVREQLKGIVLESRDNEPRGDRVIMNAAVLVERFDEKAFDRRVKEIGRSYDQLLTFTYTGPWPPYHFLTRTLKLEKAN